MRDDGIVSKNEKAEMAARNNTKAARRKLGTCSISASHLQASRSRLSHARQSYFVNLLVDRVDLKLARWSQGASFSHNGPKPSELASSCLPWREAA